MKRIITDTITEEQFVKLLRKVKKDNHKLAFSLGFYQAMRLNEVVNLKPENIDFEQHLIKIKKAKGKKDRHIPIVKPLLLPEQTMLRALKKLPVGCGGRALQIAFKNYGIKILNEKIHFHTLRHSGATWLLNKKRWNTREVQRFLGHSKIETTTIYTHVTPQDLIALEWKDD